MDKKPSNFGGSRPSNYGNSQHSGGNRPAGSGQHSATPGQGGYNRPAGQQSGRPGGFGGPRPGGPRPAGVRPPLTGPRPPRKAPGKIILLLPLFPSDVPHRPHEADADR